MRESLDSFTPRLSCLQTKSTEVVVLNKRRIAVVISYLKTQHQRKRFESAMQAMDMTMNFNRHPVHNYRTNFCHEEGNDHVPYGYGYRTADDIEERLGINDG